jgi:gliding motility-associated-like protein
VSDTAAYEFVNPPTIAAAFTVEITGCGSISHTGSIVVDTIIGHNPPYKFRWHDETSVTTWYDGVTNLSRTELPSGEYFFTVFDSIGVCYEVFRNNTFPVTVLDIKTEINATQCAYYNPEQHSALAPDGSISITHIQTHEGDFTDFSQFSFAWEDSQNQTQTRAENLSQGSYYVNITGTNECVTRMFAGSIEPRVTLHPSIIAEKTSQIGRETICFGDSLQLQAMPHETFITGYTPATAPRNYVWLSTANNTTAALSAHTGERIWAMPHTNAPTDSSRVQMYYTFDGCTSVLSNFSISHFDALNVSLRVYDSNNMLLQGDSVFVELLELFVIEPDVEPWYVAQHPQEDGIVSISWSSQNISKTQRGQIPDTITNETGFLQSGNYGLQIEALVSSYYNALVYTRNECVESHEVFVGVLNDIFVPTGITPNGDGDNDVWIIPYLYSCPNAVVKVFNRWGVKVYENNDTYYNNPWDGKNKKGELLPMGTYYYIIEYNDDVHTPSKAGSITILY